MFWDLNKKADILQTTNQNPFLVDENIGTPNEMIRQFVPDGIMDNKLALVWAMTWSQTDDNALPETMLT